MRRTAMPQVMLDVVMIVWIMALLTENAFPSEYL